MIARPLAVPAFEVLQALSDWEVASAEISTLSEAPEEPEKPATTEDKAAAKQDHEEISCSKQGSMLDHVPPMKSMSIYKVISL